LPAAAVGNQRLGGGLESRHLDETDNRSGCRRRGGCGEKTGAWSGQSHRAAIAVAESAGDGWAVRRFPVRLPAAGLGMALAAGRHRLVNNPRRHRRQGGDGYEEGQTGGKRSPNRAESIIPSQHPFTDYSTTGRKRQRPSAVFCGTISAPESRQAPEPPCPSAPTVRPPIWPAAARRRLRRAGPRIGSRRRKIRRWRCPRSASRRRSHRPIAPPGRGPAACPPAIASSFTKLWTVARLGSCVDSATKKV